MASANTYGFAGDPAHTSPPPGDGGDSVSKTRDGAEVPGVLGVIDGRERPFDQNVSGQSPVSGLGITPTFSDAITGSEVGYDGNNASTGSGTANTLCGGWPIPGSDLDPPMTKTLAKRGAAGKF